MSAAYVIGTFDTKGPELRYVRDLLREAGLRTVSVDVSTGEPQDGAVDVTAAQVAAGLPSTAAALHSGDRGAAVAAMTAALQEFLPARTDLAGVIGLGGSGGTAVITAGMRALPVGVPKVMVSTMASGDVGDHVGPVDLTMVHSVTDVAGLTSISRTVLGNAAHALAGMLTHPVPVASTGLPGLGLTMFGVTTPCVTRVAHTLADRYECLVFHATGVGGRAMEKLVDDGRLSAVLDISTTEIADLLCGGVLAAGPDRLGSVVRTAVPYVGSCGALDMVNFGARRTLPERHAKRLVHEHNPAVTLMRTTVQEAGEIGAWIADRLNAMPGQVRFLLPEGGLSALDAPGGAFWDPAADHALFEALERGVEQNDRRRLLRRPEHINDPAFADALVAALDDVHPYPEREAKP